MKQNLLSKIQEIEFVISKSSKLLNLLHEEVEKITPKETSKPVNLNESIFVLKIIEEIGNTLLSPNRTKLKTDDLFLTKIKKIRDHQLAHGYITAQESESLIDIHQQVYRTLTR